jgi:hypothetical protein
MDENTKFHCVLVKVDDTNPPIEGHFLLTDDELTRLQEERAKRVAEQPGFVHFEFTVLNYHPMKLGKAEDVIECFKDAYMLEDWSGRV